MQFSNFLLATIVSVVLAAPATTKGPGFVSLPIARKQFETPNSISKRWFDASLQNNVNSYFINLQIGSNAQEFELVLDTGSSDLWVYGADAGWPSYYNPSASTTSELVEGQFLNITYVKGSATGPYYLDTVQAADATVYNQQFGVAASSAGLDIPGILGISFTDAVADWKKTEGKLVPETYNNFPQSLVDQGLISHNAYSLFLDDLDASTGSIIFGGKDTAKYNGPLFQAPFLGVYQNAFDVLVSVNNHGGQFAGVLDSGTSYTYLPDEIAVSIAAEFGATFDPVLQLYVIDSPPDNSLTFNFGNGQIVVPGSELVVPWSSSPYIFSIQSSNQSQLFTLLGDTFLRSAYVIYDLDSRVASIAQASYSSESNIVPL